MSAPTDSDEILEIRPSQGWPRLELGEVWRNLEIIYILALRETKVRYKQRFVGMGWSVLQPLVTMVVFTVLFDRLAKVPTGGPPYPPFALAALVPWTYFSHALTKCTTCLVENEALLTRVYFPRLILPLSAVIAGLVDFFIAFVLLMIVLLAFGIYPGVAILALPFYLVLGVLTALGIGLWLSAINVEYRDVNNALPFVTQTMLFVTPVAYASNLIPESWRYVYALNPMVAVINGFRWALLEGQPAPGTPDLLSAGVSIVVLIGGLYFFRRREERFADVV
jgi:lipopolysaccharide transport system permease protein